VRASFKVVGMRRVPPPAPGVCGLPSKLSAHSVCRPPHTECAGYLQSCRHTPCADPRTRSVRATFKVVGTLRVPTPAPGVCGLPSKLSAYSVCRPRHTECAGYLDSMRIPARLVAFALLVSLLGLPLVLPLGELMSAGSWEAWTEAGRVGELALNTLGLCALTLLLAFPPGGGLAVLLYRTDLPGRSAWRAVLGVGLFVPLPLFALA